MKSASRPPARVVSAAQRLFENDGEDWVQFDCVRSQTVLVMLEIEEPDDGDSHGLACHGVPARWRRSELGDDIGSRLIEIGELGARAHISTRLVRYLRDDRLAVRGACDHEVDVLVALLEPSDNPTIDLIRGPLDITTSVCSRRARGMRERAKMGDGR